MLRRLCLMGVCLILSAGFGRADDLEPLRYNRDGLVVDLGVGLWAWPLPMDFDGDGDFDLLVSCPDKPFNGTYWFENPGDDRLMPVFAAPVRIGPGFRNIGVSHVGGRPRVLVPGREFRDFLRRRFADPVDLPLPANIHPNRVRANQWSYADVDADGDWDIVVGVGDWTEYGWDDAFNEKGEWTRGPLRGLVYVVKNEGTNDQPRYAEPALLRTTQGRLVEVYGRPSPNLADFDGDGDLDLLCGEFLDRFTYFQNVGNSKSPRFAPGRFLTHQGELLRMDLQMIVPSAVDWDRDGDVDLVVGDEDGRVAVLEHTGRVLDGVPQFRPPRYFRQQADLVKFGALVTPFGFDWDGDGDDDLLCGNTAGRIAWIENLDGGNPPKWAPPKLLKAGEREIRIQAGPNGSIQGPCEAKWGYTTLSVADWDKDGLPDLVVNSIWGKVVWYRNTGTRRKPRLAEARSVRVDWNGPPPKPEWTWWSPGPDELVTQWRTTPVAIDFTGDGLTDLVMLDHEGYLALFERKRRPDGTLVLTPGRRIFVDEQGVPLRLNPHRAGKSGRRKIHLVDWDGDGDLDLLVNSTNADLLEQVERRGEVVVFRNRGPLATRKLAGHTSSPTTVDFDGDGRPELLVGAEDGHLYYQPRSDD